MLHFTTIEDGREEVRRKPSEPPYAMLEAPRVNGCRLWAITYRDIESDTPFHGSPNKGTKTRADAEYELERTARVASDYQLGLAATP